VQLGDGRFCGIGDLWPKSYQRPENGFGNRATKVRRQSCAGACSLTTNLTPFRLIMFFRLLIMLVDIQVQQTLR
jgi:hypothetical protein